MPPAAAAARLAVLAAALLFSTGGAAIKGTVLDAFQVAGFRSAVAALVLWNKGPEFGPKWYSVALAVTAVPSVWIGGWWRTRASVAAQ